MDALASYFLGKPLNPRKPPKKKEKDLFETNPKLKASLKRKHTPKLKGKKALKRKQ